MCDPSYPTRPPDANDAVTSTQISLEAVTNDGTAPKETVLLQTATAQCSGESSNAHVRVMFDGGSQRSYITTQTAQKLGCELVGQERLSVGFFGGHREERPFRKVKVFLETKRGEKRELEVLETDVICDQTIPKPPKETLEKLEALGYECADSNDHGPKDIGLLIGADYLWDLTTGRTVKLGKRLRAVETAAGWTVQGPVEGSNNDGHCTQTVMLRTSVVEMTSDTPSKHWTLESIDVIEENETTSTALEFFESNSSMATRKDFECGALSTTELNRAELFWVRHEQKKGLLREFKSVQEERQLPADSPLRNTSLMIDEMGVLRISGRLQHSNMTYEAKHPSVPPREGSTANLLIKRCHHQVLHGGIRDTLTQLREKYWVVGARQLVKKSLRECATCQRFHALPANEVLAPLPRDRITEAQPFEVTGLDFAGPLLIKGASAAKCYIALFTCGVTRAVHLELVNDMSTTSFLLALRRFIARRGIPSTIYSDNAPTFKKANKDLASLWSAVRSEEVRDYIANSRVKWKFIVESAPRWGGFYERFVGLTKQALKTPLELTT